MKKQEGNALVWLIVIIIIVALAFWYFMKSGYKLPQKIGEGPSIMTAGDLSAAAKDLDGTNLNQMDSGINQISADSSSF